MISRINIKSYRGINSLELNNLQKINLLTGDNNSGKTSVLEVISTFGQPDILRSWYRVSRADNQIEGVSLYERMNDLFCINGEEKKITYTIETEEECTKVELIAKDSYDAGIIRQGNQFVDTVDTKRKYLTQRRYITKAKFDVYFSIRTSAAQFSECQDIIRGVKWEDYIGTQSEFEKLAYLNAE